MHDAIWIILEKSFKLCKSIEVGAPNVTTLHSKHCIMLLNTYLVKLLHVSSSLECFLTLTESYYPQKGFLT